MQLLTFIININAILGNGNSFGCIRDPTLLQLRGFGLAKSGINYPRFRRPFLIVFSAHDVTRKPRLISIPAEQSPTLTPASPVNKKLGPFSLQSILCPVFKNDTFSRMIRGVYKLVFPGKGTPQSEINFPSMVRRPFCPF